MLERHLKPHSVPCYGIASFHHAGSRSAQGSKKYIYMQLYISQMHLGGQYCINVALSHRLNILWYHIYVQSIAIYQEWIHNRRKCSLGAFESIFHIWPSYGIYEYVYRPTGSFHVELVLSVQYQYRGWCYFRHQLECVARIMMTSSNRNIFHATGLLCGELTGDRWIPDIKANDAELWCFLWSAPE